MASSRCSRLLAILTPTSVASANVLDEVSFAIDQSKQVIPILVEDCAVPFRLAATLASPLPHRSYRAARASLSLRKSRLPAASRRARVAASARNHESFQASR